jgi:hypothetical protein
MYHISAPPSPHLSIESTYLHNVRNIYCYSPSGDSRQGAIHLVGVLGIGVGASPIVAPLVLPKAGGNVYRPVLTTYHYKPVLWVYR